MIAILIGASGATGKAVLQNLLALDDYTRVKIFVRKSMQITHPKLQEFVVDMTNIDSFRNEICGDVLISTLGTTLKDAGSKANQWKIDYEIPYRFSEIAKKNGVSKMVLLSAFNANASSSFYYSKLKGSLEDAVLKLDFDHTIIFRPGIIDRPNSNRLGEKLGVKLIKFFNRIGFFQSQKPIQTQYLGQKIAQAPINIEEKKVIYSLSQI